MKTSKKQVKKENLYLSIYNLIKEGVSLKGICYDFGISKQSLQYYITKLKEQGLIVKKGYGTWEVKKEIKDFSVGVSINKPTTNLHALNINFPILKGKIMDDDWKVKNKLNNWIPKYKNLDILGGLNIRNNNNKSITVFVHSRDIKNVDEVDELSRKVQAYVYDYFRKEGVILDILGCKVNNLNLATEDKHSESMRKKGETFVLDLGRKAEKIFPKDSIDAKALIDGSPFKFSAETNDKKWKELYLTMPFNVHNIYYLFSEIAQSMSEFAKESKQFGVYMKAHVSAIQELKGMARAIKKDVSQKKLNEF